MAEMKYFNLQTYAEELKKRNMLKDCNLYGKKDQTITTLTFDSRAVKENTLFICKGAAFKAEYLQQSVSKGAVAYVGEHTYELNKEVPYILVKDIRKSMAVLANLFYNRPWEDLNVIAFGGTKGKSTSAFYMKAVIDDYMDMLGKKDSAILSSIEMYDGKTSQESHMTTPEAVELQRHLRNVCESGIDYVQMEVSSQALKYHRVDDMKFDIGVFLNISEDHISPIEHKDFEDYISSKMLMFAKTKTAIVNLDIDELDRVLEEAKAAEEVITFSMQNEKADFYAYNVRKEGNATKFMVKCHEFDEEFILTMPGLFNVENALSVIASAVKLGIPVKCIRSGLERARSKGRMELFASKDNKIIAIVDFAHNKLSFQKLFSSMQKEYPEHELIAIFGCPGNKAFNRRKDMGTIAGKYAKKVYIVADDPAFETYEDISNEIAKYVEEQNCPYEKIENRGEAIAKVIRNAKEKTLLIVAGKGRERNLKYGNEYVDCPSDVDYVEKYIKEYNESYEQ